MIGVYSLLTFKSAEFVLIKQELFKNGKIVNLYVCIYTRKLKNIYK